jgi:Mg-chelatase subunit ChlD
VVKKDFSDDNSDAVSVGLVCASGAVTVVDGSASEADPAEFRVTGYSGDPICTASESPIPTGYDSTGTCAAALVGAGECTITNTLRSAQFVVSKDFVPDSDASVNVSLTCSDGTVVSTPLQASEAAPAVFTVEGFTNGTTCTATETVPAGYTADQSDCLNVDLVSDGVCTMSNTLKRSPVDVMLVLDRSGSMGDPPVPIADVKAAAKAFVDQLDPDVDQVGLVSYADWASLDHELASGESGFDSVKSAIDGLSASGYTNIGDAVYDAQQELESVRHNPDAIPVIVLLTDGIANRRHVGGGCATWPTSPTVCTEDAINQAAAAKANGTIIFTVGLALVWDDQPAGVGALARSVLRTMATPPWTDYYFETTNPADLQGIFEQIAAIITNIFGPAGTASGGSDGSDHLPATLALAAVAPMLAVIPISRLWRRRK